MPRQRKNPSEPLECSGRSVTPYQTYVNHLITKKPEKIKALLARALNGDGYLEDFNGQVHANECVFSYPDSNWYSVYLVNRKTGEPYWGEDGAKKYYFQLDVGTDNDGVLDAAIVNGTTETPDELMRDGVEIKNCSVKNGKCANPEPKKKKKKAVKEEDFEDEEQGETPEEILESLKKQTGKTGGTKQKMPRTYFESLRSKNLIIEWMITNMKSDEIMKCIQRGNLTAEEVQQAENILDSRPESGGSGSGTAGGIASEIEALKESFSPSEIDKMIKVVTKKQLVDAMKRITDVNRRRQLIITTCRRAGVKKYSITTNSKGKSVIVDEDGDPVDDINDVIDICAEKEAFRIRKLLKLKSISQDFNKGNRSKAQLIAYGKKVLPYVLIASVKRHFPMIRKYTNRDGELYASIPGGMDDGEVYYFKVADVTGNDLAKLDAMSQQGVFGVSRKDLIAYGNKVLPFSLKDSVKQYYPLIRKYTNQDGELYASIPGGIDDDGEIYYFKVADVTGKDLAKLDAMSLPGNVSFGKRRVKQNFTRLRRDLNKLKST